MSESNYSYKFPNLQGYYGSFGGAYIPEMLFKNVSELQSRYESIINERSFQEEFQLLLKDYAAGLK